MPGFDAGTVVEPLDWDFTAFKAGKGTVPEPSDERLGKFLRDVMAAQSSESASLAPLTEAGDDTEKLLAAIAALPEDALPGATKAMIKPYADLCDGSPTEDQLTKLPPRVRVAFFSWLAGELRPEASSAGSKPALRSVS
jgi:hypothetical protein